nr:MAG: replication associated protein [Cressdnaviricota sp.]
MPSSTFQFCSKTIFATYPQANNATKEELMCFYKGLGEYAYICVGQESHATEGLHYHVAAKYINSVRTKSSSYFDINGHHPNIQGARNFSQVVTYCQKDGNFIEEGSYGGGIKRTWTEVLNCSNNREEFMNMVMMNYPREYVLNHEKLEYYANKKYTSSVIRYVCPDYSFLIPSILDEWISGSLIKPCIESKFLFILGPLSLWLVGPSRFGKTEWARSLGNHIYWNTMTDLSRWTDDCNYLIFDDFDWKFVPNKKSFFGGQKEFTISDKYTRKKTIYWGKPCIFLCNDDLDVYNTCDERLWLKDNVIYYRLLNKLY